MISECHSTFLARNKKKKKYLNGYLLKLQCDKSPKRDAELINADVNLWTEIFDIRTIIYLSPFNIVFWKLIEISLIPSHFAAYIAKADVLLVFMRLVKRGLTEQRNARLYPACV